MTILEEIQEHDFRPTGIEEAHLGDYHREVRRYRCVECGVAGVEMFQTFYLIDPQKK